MRIVVGFILMMMALPAMGSIYRCVIDGELIFSQQPCEEGAEKIGVAGSGVKPAERPAAAIDPGPDNYVAKVRLERRIARHQRNITALQRSRDRELVLLRQRMQQANNNLAGATYIQGLSTEMQAVTDSYTSRIDVEQRSIDRLLTELDRLE